MRFFETIGFLFQYICKPRSTGALCPSSRFLARRMASGANSKNINANDVVVELGAGTGSVTRELIKSDFLCGRKLFSIEYNSELCTLLKKNIPDLNVIEGSAENIRELVGEDASKITTIVSSLPLLSLPETMVKNIIQEIEDALPTGGRFVQFTYQLNRKPEKLGFKKMKHLSKSIVLLNIPPARVDVFIKS